MPARFRIVSRKTILPRASKRYSVRAAREIQRGGTVVATSGDRTNSELHAELVRHHLQRSSPRRSQATPTVIGLTGGDIQPSRPSFARDRTNVAAGHEGSDSGTGIVPLRTPAVPEVPDVSAAGGFHQP